MYPESENPHEINNLPLLQFTGNTVIVNNRELEQTCLDELTGIDLIGFDTETKPSFKKGQSFPVAMIQLAKSDKAYIFRIGQYGLTQNMVELFEDPKVRKVGIAIKDDLSSLQKLNHFEPQGFLDLSKLALEVGLKKTGIRNLTSILLGNRISKKQQTSNWESSTLTENQIIYAATDAWVCIDLFKKLDQMSSDQG